MKNLNILLIIVLLLITNVVKSQTLYANDFNSLDSTLYENKDLTYDEVIDFIKVEYNGNKLNQARAISIWICNNITYQVDLFNYDFQLNLTQILRIKKGSCNAYAYLFKTMCDSIGIECEKISGLSKTSGYVAIVGHAWNAIIIDNKTILIDVTWMNSNDTNGYYDNSWFNSNPKYFIYTHYPYRLIFNSIITDDILKTKNVTNILRTNQTLINGSMEMMGCQGLEKPITLEYFLALPDYIKWSKSDYKPLRPFPIKKMWYLNK